MKKHIGAKGVVRLGKHGVQAVIGLKVQQVADALSESFFIFKITAPTHRREL